MAESDECRDCRWDMACTAGATILAVALATVPAYRDDLGADNATEERDRPLLPRSA